MHILHYYCYPSHHTRRSGGHKEFHFGIQIIIVFVVVIFAISLVLEVIHIIGIYILFPNTVSLETFVQSSVNSS